MDAGPTILWSAKADGLAGIGACNLVVEKLVEDCVDVFHKGVCDV